MSNIQTAYRAGYQSVFALKIEGIPHLFVERIPVRHDSTAAPSAATGYTTATTHAALVIDQDASISSDIDRKSGIGKGKGLAFRLLLEELPAGLFQRQTVVHKLMADVDDAATSLTVGTLPAETAPYKIHIGNEAWQVDSESGSSAPYTLSWAAANRGKYGPKYYHDRDSPTSYHYLTVGGSNLWRGRQVWLYEHILDRSGRMLDSQWLAGTYYREIWHGTIDEPPIPTGHTMEIRCQMYLRKLGREVGYTTKWDVARVQTDAWGGWLSGPAWVAHRSQYVIVRGNFTESSTAYDFEVHVGQYDSPTGTTKRDRIYEGPAGPTKWHNWFVDRLAHELGNLSGSWAGTKDIIDSIAWIDQAESLGALGSNAYSVRYTFDWAAGITMNKLVFIAPETGGFPWYRPGATEMGAYNRLTVLMREHWDESNCLPWLALRSNQGEGINDQTVIANGVGILEGTNGVQEVVRWGEARTGGGTASDAATVLDSNETMVFVEILERGVNGGDLADMMNPEQGQVSLATGTAYVGQFGPAMLTMMESSGGGHLGSYDTLGTGLGLAVSSGDIDEASITGLDIGEMPVAMVKEGTAKFADIFGGWLVLVNRCLVAYQTGTEVKIKAVDFSTAAANDRNKTQTVVEAGDVIMERINPALVVEKPNELKIETKTAAKKAPTVTVRDIPRIQHEGVQAWSLKAPGAPLNFAISHARAIMEGADGNGVMELTLAPWVDLGGPGDVVNLKVAHPVNFDWTTGTAGAAQVGGRVLSWSRSLLNNTQKVKLLIAGLGIPAPILAPTLTVTASDTVNKRITVSTAAEASPESWFEAGEKLVLYMPGNEGSMMTEYTIASINTTNNRITLTALSADWATAIAAGYPVRATWPVYANGSVGQRTFMYNSNSYQWANE